ncbi:hypothetical protein ACOMHN_066077 [Nucella lapillus]
MDSKQTYLCTTCGARFTQRCSLTRHTRTVHSKTKKKADYLCDRCGKGFSRKEYYARHLTSHDSDSGDGGPSPAKKIKRDHPPLPPPSKDPRLAALYKQHAGAIRTGVVRGQRQTRYTFQWPHFQTNPGWKVALTPLFLEQTFKFKINWSHSLVLRHVDTGEYRFFHACQNNARALEFPRLIGSREGFDGLLKDVLNEDVLEYARQHGPNTKWRVYGIPSTTFYATPLEDYPIGCCDQTFPDFVTRNGYVLLLTTNPQRRIYTDRLCFFRCLGVHLDAEDVDAESRRLFATWAPGEGVEGFPGIPLKDLGKVERVFDVNVDVYEFINKKTLRLVRRGVKKHSTTLRLLLCQEHFAYITDINRVSRSFQCSKCGKLTPRLWNLRRHMDVCEGPKVKDVFKGGVYHYPFTALQTLRGPRLI